MSDAANVLDFVTNQQNSSIGSGQLSLEPTTKSYTGTPPWIEFPEGGYAFDYQGQTNMPGVGSTSTVVTFTVPDGYDGVIKRFSINYTGGANVTNPSDLIYRITADARPIKGYSNIITDLGTTQIPRFTDGIRIYSNQVIAITVTHANNVTLGQPVYGTIAGWYYPRQGE